MCAALIASTLIVSSLLLVSGGVSADIGDADPVGYYWTDSNEPAPSVTMDWVAISSSGDDAGLAGDSGSTGPFPLGLDFTFYEQNYSMFNVSIDGGAWAVYDSSIVLTADGAHVVDFYTIDLAGREETMQTLLIDIDQLPPVTTASVADEYDVTLTAIDAGIGVDYTMYRLDEGTWTLYTGMFTAGTTGLVLVEFYSVDLMGNIEDVRSVLAGDMVAPTTSYEVEGTAGEAGWYVSDVTIALTSEDNADGSGVDHVSYRIDGESWYTYSVPVGLTAEGEHTFEFYAEDVAGNIEDTQSLSVDIDTEAPITAYVVTNSTVTLTASDPTSGVGVTMYRIDGGDWTVYTAPFEVTGSGNHTVEFSATDAAGNVEDVQTIYVDNGTSGLSALTIGLVAALAAAVAIGLTVFLLMKRRKGPGAPAPPPQDVPPPPEA